jgi:serine/threonine protein kinase
MKIEHLSKQGGARLTCVDTYKVACEANDIEGQESLKSAHEVGTGINQFTHVLRSVLAKKHQVIVKVLDASSGVILHELNCMKHLKDFRNTVTYICDFVCADDKKRWMYNITSQRTLCDPNGEDLLHFIVMEFIENGSIDEYISEIEGQDTLYLSSFILQIALAIMEMGTVHKVYHGDLNTGNILIYRTSKKHITYKVFDKEYKVKSNGIYPVFIDFGRGGLYKKTSKNKSEIIDDITIALSVIEPWISSKPLKQKLAKLTQAIYKAPRDDLHHIIELLRSGSKSASKHT